MTTARKLTPKQQQKMVAAYVERVYAECCTGSGKQIGIMDIGKVFAAGATTLWAEMRAQQQRAASGALEYDAAALHDAVAAAMTAAFEQYRVKP
jgi:hypothetical protein